MLGRVDVPILCVAAAFAAAGVRGQADGLVGFAAACTAQLGSVWRISLDQPAAGPFSLAGQLGRHQAPPPLVNRTSQTAVPGHVQDVQVLGDDAGRPAFDELGGQPAAFVALPLRDPCACLARRKRFPGSRVRFLFCFRHAVAKPFIRGIGSASSRNGLAVGLGGICQFSRDVKDEHSGESTLIIIQRCLVRA